jgi:ATP-dependent DNA helicase RecG
MISLCREADLPEPEFRQDGGQFVMILWRDWFTETVLTELNLNERQKQALAATRKERQMTNARYQQIATTTRATAKRDLEDLVRKGVLVRSGSGRGVSYRIPRKRLINGSNGPSAESM